MKRIFTTVVILLLIPVLCGFMKFGDSVRVAFGSVTDSYASLIAVKSNVSEVIIQSSFDEPVAISPNSSATGIAEALVILPGTDMIIPTSAKGNTGGSTVTLYIKYLTQPTEGEITVGYVY